MTNILDIHWKSRIEQVILELADEFEIRVDCDPETKQLKDALAFVGEMVKGYEGRSMGAEVGARIGRAAGREMFRPVREIWDDAKKEYQELYYIVFIFLYQRFGAVDDASAYQKLMACPRSKRDLVSCISDYLVQKFKGVTIGNQVQNSLTISG